MEGFTNILIITLPEEPIPPLPSPPLPLLAVLTTGVEVEVAPKPPREVKLVPPLPPFETVPIEPLLMELVAPLAGIRADNAVAPD